MGYTSVVYIIGLCVFFTGWSFVYPDLRIFGIHNGFFLNELYHIWILQFFSGQFLHAGIMHLVFNSICIYYFGSIVESRIGQRKMWVFFITSAIFLGISITFLSSGNTIGISGFVSAIIAFYALELYTTRHPQAGGVIVFLGINIAFGLMPGISFIGHAAGVIYGGVFWYIYTYIGK